MAVTVQQKVAGLYSAVFNRAPDQAGLTFWVNEINANGSGSLVKAAEGFTQHPVFAEVYGSLTPTQFVEQLYVNVLGSAGDAKGIQFWVDKLAAGASKGQVVAEFVEGSLSIDLAALLASGGLTKAEYDAALVRQQNLTNKVDVGLHFVERFGAATNLASTTFTGSKAGLEADPVYKASQAVLSGVTNVASTVTTAKAAIDAAQAPTALVGSATTFTLTTGVDTFAGTSGNDTFTASVVYDSSEAVTAASTLTVADQIVGGAGVDTLNITVSGAQDAGVTLPAATISGVEVFNVRNTVAQTASLDASNFAGLTSLNADRSIGAVSVTNLAAGASAGMIGNDTVTNGALNAGYAAAATAATVNVSGGTKAGAITVSGTGLTSTTVNSTGSAANTIGALTLAATTTSLTIDAAAKLTTGAVTNTTAAALTTLTVKGAGAVDLSTNALESTVKTIDASANTGGLTAKLSNAVDIKVTGSKGNDVITTNAILTTGTVDGGDGVDTLDIGSNVGHANTASLAAKYTNFETLRVNGTFDASLIAGITAIELSGATNNISKMTAAQAAAVTARANIGDTTLALATATGTADVLSLTMGTGLTTSAATTAGALTINGFETLNVKANPGATAVSADKTATIGSFTADSLTAINLTGTAVTLSNAATTKAVTIDGTALTGNGAAAPIGLTISGNLVAGSVVKGSLTAGNTFNLGTAGSTYTGGAGKDAFNISAVTQLRSGATYNKIDGGAGEDTLTLTAGAAAVTMVDDDFKEIANVEKMVVTNTGTNAINITTGGWYDAAFKTAGSDLTITGTDAAAVTFTGGTFTGNQKLTVSTAATTQDVAVLTGSGNDTVKVTVSALTTGDITVGTGAGNDAIEVVFSGTTNLDTGAVVTINGGAGKDTIKLDGLAAADAQFVTVTVGAGQSTIAAYDSITGYSLGGTDKSVVIDFADTAAVAGNLGNTSITGYTAGELLYSITNGFLSFSGTKAAALTLAEKITIVDSVITTNLQTVAFKDGNNTYLYNENSAGDSLIELVGISTADTLALGGGTASATTIQIL